MNLATIRDDLKARLATISGLQTYDTVPAKPEVPCAIVQPESGSRVSFERGSLDIRFLVTMMVQCADWPSAQDALDGYVSIGAAGSVTDAVEGFSTGSEDATVESWDSYGIITYGENLYGTVVFHVLVEASS